MYLWYSFTRFTIKIYHFLNIWTIFFIPIWFLSMHSLDVLSAE